MSGLLVIFRGLGYRMLPGRFQKLRMRHEEKLLACAGLISFFLIAGLELDVVRGNAAAGPDEAPLPVQEPLS